MSGYRAQDHGVVVEEMSKEDIAEYFPEHIRKEMTGKFKALQPDEKLADAVLERAAHS